MDILEIPRGWPSIDLPGYRNHPTKPATYSTFEYDELPPIRHDLDDELAWLLSEPPVQHSLDTGQAVVQGWEARPATDAELGALTGNAGLRLPRAFEAFVRRHEPRTRIRSCTACYLDLGDSLISVDGRGRLIHFLRDSQDVWHWLLYIDETGAEAVVATSAPYGFDDAKEPDFDPASFDPSACATTASVVCADSFSEFIYRFWIENEIWHTLSGLTASTELTLEQKAYAEHYLRLRS